MSDEAASPTSIGIVGDGPGGLSAALFLAKAGHAVTIFGRDATAMNYAHLYNYLGLPEIGGTEFQRIAKDQVSAFGATLVDATVTSVERDDGGFRLTTEAGETTDVDYLILTEGKNAPLAESLGAIGDDAALTRDGRTAIDRLYVVGRTARPKRSQAIISAGDGAAAALDILADISGSDVQDWDSPPKS
ncbi:MAG TPA: FAD-dependent oxidoreductase [Ilumatobacter sp.]|nr:FAD-dependent oxidoreductase [Ilumatobacter sp.]